MDDHNARGIELFGRGRLEDAIAEWRVASRLAPLDHRFPANIGGALSALNRHVDAVAASREALRLNPSSTEAMGNLGRSLSRLGDLDGAIASHVDALRIRPGCSTALYNLACALDAAGRHTEAAEVFGAVLAIVPNDHEARCGRGMARLAMGDFGGWSDFEGRLDRPRSLAREVPGVPRWRGESLNGELLLNATLDGYGDAIQGVRFAPAGRRRVGSTVLLCDPPIASLMTRFPGVDRVVTSRDELPSIAAQTSVLGLAAVLDATPGTMATEGPYLSADLFTVERWRPALTGIPGLRVGVVWQGDPRHVNDLRRSFRLADLEPLTEIPGVSLVSLQRGAGTDQLADAGFPIVHLGPEFAAADMLDTAGILEHLDLFIGADTGIMHVAGAMGRPTWIALASPASDWRWMHGRDDSPWYPTVRLFRQDRPGDWSGVFRRMAEALSGVVRRTAPGPV